MNVACGWPVAALFAALALNTAACRGILGIHDLTGGESDAATPREVSTSDEVDGEAAAATPLPEASSPTEAGDATLESSTSPGDDATGDSPGMPDVNGPVSEGATCSDVCVVGGSRCESTGVQTCTEQASRCTDWEVTTTCQPDQSCTVTNNVAVCACTPTLCTEAGSVCQDSQTLATCTKDANGCYVVASTTQCAPATCSGMQPNAACSLACTNSCQMGQSTCNSGGVSTCTLGSNGCLSYGPAMPCGPHQSCSSSAGKASCACTPSVCTSTADTCADAVTLATCASDSQSCFYESSTMSCAPSCIANKCGCMPGSTRCVGTAQETCDANGNWPSTGQVSAGLCGAVCTPSSVGGCATASALQVCSATGAWVSSQCGSNVCTGNACVTATAIALADDYGNALMADGSVQCWGTSPIGVPGIPGLAISIAAGDISCAILSDNTVACWSTCGSTAALVSGLTAKSLALAGQLCAVLMDGSVKCGSTWTALLQSSAILTGVAQVANNPDQDFTCALKTDGTVWCWGNNGEGELGTGSGLPSSSATPLPTGINNAVTVSTGGATDDSDDHACVLLSTGGVECWGGNFDGAIGNGTTGATVPTPYPITSLASAISVAAGDDFSCAVLSTGSAACWGANYEGMLGNGTLAPSPSPGAVLYVTNAKAIAARTWEACVLNNDGSVQCWGTLLGNGSTATSTATPVYVSGI